MALRVLLADESTTIKRVMQLALQDFAVEVKAVPVGMDVVPVTKAFKPDIIFADVLLPKKSGYEVSKDLKKDSETKGIPVVLMWSGFMEIDEAKAKESMAERRLEKPFEPETLRNLVLELVKKTQKNPVSSYLTFPPLPEFQEDTPIPETPDVPENTSSLNTSSDISLTTSRLFSQDLGKDNFSDEIPSLDLPDDEEFSQVPLHKATIPSMKEKPSEDWSHQDLSKFKIELPLEETSQSTAQKFSGAVSLEEEISQPEVNSYGEFDEITFIKAPTQGPSGHVELPTSGMIDHEALIRDEARKVIESIVWKILPEITERIVREEINKLLQDTEKSISVP